MNVELKMTGYNSRRVIEYASQYITRQGVPRSIFEQMAIFLGEEDEERYIESQGACDFIICDSASFLACVYAELYKPNPLDKYEIAKHNYVLKKLNSWASERTIKTYSYVFFLPFELEYVKDGTRWQENDNEAKMISNMIRGYLDLKMISYHIISGPIEDRVMRVLEILGIKKNKKI